MVLENCYNSGTVTEETMRLAELSEVVTVLSKIVIILANVIGKGGSYDSVGGIAGTCGAYSRAGTIEIATIPVL